MLGKAGARLGRARDRRGVCCSRLFLLGRDCKALFAVGGSGQGCRSGWRYVAALRQKGAWARVVHGVMWLRLLRGRRRQGRGEADCIGILTPLTHMRYIAYGYFTLDSSNQLYLTATPSRRKKQHACATRLLGCTLRNANMLTIRPMLRK